MAREPSSAMAKAARSIQRDLNIQLEGSIKSFDDVKKFLDENMEKWREFLGNRPPSEKQLNGVKLIESKLNIEFEGEMTMKDVSEFLDEYLKTALSVK